MKKDWKYILYLSIVIGIYVAVKLSETKQNDWSVTLAHADKEPYGTYALDQLLPSLFNYANKGGTVFISAHYFSDHFADTLGLSTSDYLFRNGIALEKQDTASIHFVNTTFDSTRVYPYRRDNIHNYFSQLDSTKATVVAKNDQYLPVTLHVVIGKGQLLLNCTPMAFTNIYLLAGPNNEFVSNTLS